MTSSTLLSRGALAAILATGCLIAPTAMAQSADKEPTVKDPARADVYVPPSPDTATQQDLRWLEAHGTTKDLRSPDAHKTANVYVPPVPDAGKTANVYVPPVPDAGKTANVSVPPVPDTGKTANVYVPPVPDTGETANVYVPPAQGGLPAPGSLAHPQSIARAVRPAADNGASPWAVIGLALGCAALLGGAGLALVHRARRARRAVA